MIAFMTNVMNKSVMRIDDGPHPTFAATLREFRNMPARLSRATLTGASP
jgi:hypothetical protein